MQSAGNGHCPHRCGRRLLASVAIMGLALISASAADYDNAILGLDVTGTCATRFSQVSSLSMPVVVR